MDRVAVRECAVERFHHHHADARDLPLHAHREPAGHGVHGGAGQRPFGPHLAVGHGLAGLDEVFGVYKPVEVNRQLLLAPLVNSNNLGAFAALGVPLWVGLTYRTAHREVRWLGRIAIVITAATAILSLSRGAVGQLAIEVLLVFACLRIARRRPRQGSAERTWPRAFGIAGAVIGVPRFRMRLQLQLTHVIEQRNLDNSRAQLAAEVAL